MTSGLLGFSVGGKKFNWKPLHDPTEHILFTALLSLTTHLGSL